MKLEKRSYDYKKHIIHVLVAGAMALSWGTVGARAYLYERSPAGYTRTQ